tara:strand:+ start:282 stop:1553 length:1272 start_codon:yes stop_codon:yes gene_type:complete
MSNKKFIQWFNLQKKNQKITCKIKNLKDLKYWLKNDNLIHHSSGKFFKIVGIDVKSNTKGKNWDQPIIVQKELGILGIIKDKIKNRYLLQAKVEPGNKNKLQLSPTVQATKSNYKRVHGGKKIPYLNFFLKNKNNFVSQSEQGYRYLHKSNYNSLLIIKKNIKVLNNYYWLHMKDIIKIIKKRSIFNMDTISVFSTFIHKEKLDIPLYSMNKILKWLSKKDKIFYLSVKIKPLNKLRDWKVGNDKIEHKNKNHFSVVGINVKSNKREIKEWDQPIIKGKKLALAGFIICYFNNTKHYLCKYNKKPGLKKSTLSCSVNTSDIINYKTNNKLTSFQNYLINNFFLKKSSKRFKVVYENILSDEGGRFYNCEIKYKALLINKNLIFKLPNDYIWISQNQMIKMIQRKKIDIEARLLFGCINIEKIK